MTDTPSSSAAPTGTTHAEYEVRESVAYITLDSPPLNILTVAMMDQICAMLKRVQDDPSVKALAITARGRAFSAGADVEEHHPDQAPLMVDSFSRMFCMFGELEVPIVALVEGHCLGGGFELALMAHILLATPNASFGQPEIRLGFIAPVGLAVLPERVGISRAIEITASGRRYSAEEAKELGLVRRIVPQETAHDELENVLDDFRQASPLILRMGVRTLMQSAHMPFEQARQHAEQVFLDELMATDDVREGIAAFTAKRRPVWSNR